MSIPCYEYASWCFVDTLVSPRPRIADRLTIFSGHPQLDPWFTSEVGTLGAAGGSGGDSPGGSSCSPWNLGLGDLVIFTAMEHIVVATGFQDHVVQSGYNVYTVQDAMRLSHLLKLRAEGKLPKQLPHRLGVEGVKDAMGIFVPGGRDPSERPNPEYDEYAGWATGPCTVPLHLLMTVFSYRSFMWDIYHLKPDCLTLLDPHGPLGMQVLARGISR